jgi:hypothetical protein
MVLGQMTHSQKYDFLNQFKVELCENWIEFHVIGDSVQIESIEQIELLISELTEAAQKQFFDSQ